MKVLVARGEIMSVCSFSTNWYLQTLAAWLLLPALMVAAFLFPPLVLLFIVSATLIILIQTAADPCVWVATIASRRCDSLSLRGPPRE